MPSRPDANGRGVRVGIKFSQLAQMGPGGLLQQMVTKTVAIGKRLEEAYSGGDEEAPEVLLFDPADCPGRPHQEPWALLRPGALSTQPSTPQDLGRQAEPAMWVLYLGGECLPLTRAHASCNLPALMYHAPVLASPLQTCRLLQRAAQLTSGCSWTSSLPASCGLIKWRG